MAKDPNPSDYQCNFETTFESFTKNRGGAFLKLKLHPNDIPSEVSDANLGQRWLCVLVPMPDDMPQPSAKDLDVGRAALATAGILCKQPAFQDFLGCDTEAKAVLALRKRLGVSSRSELLTNPRARRELFAIQKEFATPDDFG